MNLRILPKTSSPATVGILGIAVGRVASAEESGARSLVIGWGWLQERRVSQWRMQRRGGTATVAIQRALLTPQPQEVSHNGGRDGRVPARGPLGHPPASATRVPDVIVDAIMGWEPRGAAGMRARCMYVKGPCCGRSPGRSVTRSGNCLPELPGSERPTETENYVGPTAEAVGPTFSPVRAGRRIRDSNS
jgi:hypothetical protein